mmetsp:Transcript_11597/g.25040  ORF Transcript_11597/g.25040 Transcript_11597/m.25040 type:complete len:646 (+) Transcript_11597:99-2036(+)|eukprot:CAMPEP_0206609850 /NCGR_PEP_ID=MMETSP0325_2-20121206/54092_1 /ASSEMBLY_ACC=CAM_ASM_000347 /TAXON_ID=2866 /ORGANISM="Crypthecodinium cohnii, Strain Seligo" /LENGTH=645 /DNA_ID=CAMNT_0054128335 /DNA_START=50 /DNA_END=1987 /DNA_ORIENTATION=+
MSSHVHVLPFRTGVPIQSQHHFESRGSNDDSIILTLSVGSKARILETLQGLYQSSTAANSSNSSFSCGFSSNAASTAASSSSSRPIDASHAPSAITASDPFLVAPSVAALLESKAAEVACWAARALQALGSAAVRFLDTVASSLLTHEEATCRVAGLETLGMLGLGSPESDALAESVAECLQDRCQRVRKSAIQALSGMGASSQADHIKALLDDKRQQPVEIRVAAALALSRLVPETCAESVGEALLDILSESGWAAESGNEGEEKKEEDEDEAAEAAEEAEATLLLKGELLACLRNLGPKAPEALASFAVEILKHPSSSSSSSSSSSWELRQAACLALGAMQRQAKGALPSLEAMLRSDEPRTRAAAATAIGALGQEAAVAGESLEALLSDMTEENSSLPLYLSARASRAPVALRVPRAAALMALGRLQREGAVRSVSSALADEDWEIRKSACEGLAAYGRKAQSEIPVLCASLEDQNFQVRAMACYALGELDSAEAIGPLVERLEDSSHSVRARAVAAIASLGSKAEEYIDDVAQVLDDDIEDVRAAAALALPKLGESGHSFAPIIARLLESPSPDSRLAALEALSNCGRHGAAMWDEILEVYWNDASLAVREAAGRTLTSIGKEDEAFGAPPWPALEPISDH